MYSLVIFCVILLIYYLDKYNINNVEQLFNFIIKGKKT